jgi:hypothetical protein
MKAKRGLIGVEKRCVRRGGKNIIFRRRAGVKIYFRLSYPDPS